MSLSFFFFQSAVNKQNILNSSLDFNYTQLVIRTLCLISVQSLSQWNEKKKIIIPELKKMMPYLQFTEEYK